MAQGPRCTVRSAAVRYLRLTVMRTQKMQWPVVQHEQALLDRLQVAERRETELEALYVAGTATEAELMELEQIRLEIGDAVEALDGMGYYKLS